MQKNLLLKVFFLLGINSELIATIRALLLVVLSFVFIISSLAFHRMDNAEVIKGRIIDSVTSEPLPGANIRIKGTLKGDAADINGEFTINGATEGTVTLEVSYLGFVSKEIEYEVINAENFLVIELEPLVISGQEIVVSVQAQGQREAINQQKSSNTAVNIVSATKIQELPEANAAEAVGRLPGVTLQREGGEGNKVVIRGLSPQFNKIQVEGVNLSSTDNNNRSTDLSMISSFMLDGIEVTKAALPNQEADQIGGTVNFRLREARDEPSFNAILQGGYNNLSEEFKDYKVVLSGGDRFFKNRLGLYVNLDLEKINRSDNSVLALYDEQPITSNGLDTTFTIVRQISSQRNIRFKDRYGASAVLDYKLPNTSFKFFGMYNQIDEENTFQQENLNGGSGDYSIVANNTKETLNLATISLEVEQSLGQLKLTGGVSYNFSNKHTPKSIQMSSVQRNAVTIASGLINLGERDGLVVVEDLNLGFLHPSEYYSLLRDEAQTAPVDQILLGSQELFQDELSTSIKAEYEWNLGEHVAINLEVGTKFKKTTRDFDNDQYRHELSFAGITEVTEAWYAEVLRRGDEELLNGWVPSSANRGLPFNVFLDNNFSQSEFFTGQLTNVLDVDIISDYIDLLNLTTEGNSQGLSFDFASSTLGDYDGEEEYLAYYVMPTVKLGKKLMLIPGFRYEKNQTSYTGFRASGTGRFDFPFAETKVTTDRENSFFLPMIHLRYNITDWMDIKGSYTETISRPNFNLLRPFWVNSNANTLNWNDPFLKPIEATNYDATLSFYTNKVGLVSISGFYKTISNFVFFDNTYIFDEAEFIDSYPEGLQTPVIISGPINNPNDATLYGTEIEWQSNFWFLPGVWKGLVYGINYTYTYSETIYPRTLAVRGGFPAFRIIDTEDASYKDRLLDQPDHTLNSTLGFDYKGFSIRGSMRYKAGIFSGTNSRPSLRQNTEGIVLYDLSISQKISALEGLSAFLNAANIGESIDQTSNEGTGWYTGKYFYGFTAQVGLRYQL